MKIGMAIDSHFKTYDSLIEFARSNQMPTGNKRFRHHVLPINAGGDQNGETLFLTRYEHVLAHYMFALENPKYRRVNLRSCLCIIDFSSRNRIRFDVQGYIEGWLRMPIEPKVRRRKTRSKKTTVNLLRRKNDLSVIH
jgi:hypothetical protein